MIDFSFKLPDDMKIEYLNSLHLQLPTKGSILAAGYDFFATENIHIYPNSSVFIETYVKVNGPIGWWGLLKERSSLAKKGLLVRGGVIDCDYIEDTIKVVLYNCNDEEPIFINKGDKYIQYIPIPTLIQTPAFLDRKGGFGSTGK